MLPPFGHLESEERLKIQAVTLGQAPAEGAVMNAKIMLVQSGEIFSGHIAWVSGRIAYVGQDTFWLGDQTKVVDAQGLYALPLFMESHSHPWVGYNPDTLARAWLARGIGSAVADTLDLQLRLPATQLLSLLQALERSPFTWLWSARPFGQGGQRGEAGFVGDIFEALMDYPRTVQVGEWTDWPLLLGDQAVARRVDGMLRRGLRLDGHAPGASAQKISALAVSGISACHEAITADEALIRLRAGLWVILRHSSLRQDLGEWLQLAATHPNLNWSRCLLTHDGANPSWVEREGGVDGIVAQLIDGGIPEMTAVQMATINPATYWGIDHAQGMIAPGRLADVQLRTDFSAIPDVVIKQGTVVAQWGELIWDWSAPPWETFSFRVLPAFHSSRITDPGWYRTVPDHSLTGQFVSTAIVRRSRSDHPQPDALRAVLISRDGRHYAAMWLENFAPRLDGLATTFVDSGAVLVIGRSPESMALAVFTLLSRGGGLAVASGTRLEAWMELPLGRMSPLPLAQVAQQYEEAYAAVQRAGYAFDDLLYSLDFLTGDFLPDLRLLEQGVYDVKNRRIVAAAQLLN